MIAWSVARLCRAELIAGGSEPSEGSEWIDRQADAIGLTEHRFRFTLGGVLPVPIANPPNPWASTEVEYLEAPPPEMRLEIYEDHSRQVLAENDSPDVGFRYSVNPYRGCFHGCAYCYARPSHEYLSFGAGTDFERPAGDQTARARVVAGGVRQAQLEA
jgi:hypothetical protein